MPIKQISPPADEPVSLAEAKVHLRVEWDHEDLLIGALIGASRADAENKCGRVLVTQSLTLYLDTFPSRGFDGFLAVYEEPLNQYGAGLFQKYSVRMRGGAIELPFPRLQSVDSIKYIDTAGVLQTLSPALYTVDNVSEPGVLMPAPSQYWPVTQIIMNAVQISYTAGYGAAAAVPPGIKAWMLMRIGAMYENREEISVGRGISVSPLTFVDRLLDPYLIARL
jgi:uncharacterized phiE125 gp8 family phage protein